VDVKCASCGADMALEDKFCPACGQAPVASAGVPIDEGSASATAATPTPASTEQAAYGSPPVSPQKAGIRYSPPLLIFGASTLLLFIALFLPWWTASVAYAGAGFSASVNGFDSWGWVTFIAWLASLGLLARMVVGPKLVAGTPLEHTLDERKIFLGVAIAGIAQIVGAVLFVIFTATPSVNDGLGTTASASISAGVIIALIAGVGTLYSGLTMLKPTWLDRFTPGG